MKRCLGLLVLPLIVGCASAPERVEAPRLAPFPPAAGELVVRPNKRGEILLPDVIDEWARLTGLVVIVDPDSRTLIGRRHQRLCLAEDQPIHVPSEEVQSFVEGLLSLAGWVVLPVLDTEPRTVRVVSLQARGGLGVRRHATYVPLEELAGYASHPALLVSTAVAFPGDTDVRRLFNSMRASFYDSRTQSLVPIGNHTLLVRGRAPDVLRVVDQLRNVGAHSSARYDVAPATLAALTPSR